MSGTEELTLDELLELAQWKFELSLPDEIASNKPEIAQKIIDTIKKNNMTPYYVELCTELPQHFSKDEALLSQMTAHNEKELNEIEEKIKDAEENFGETEIRDSLVAKAVFFHKIGDKEKALTAYRYAYDKTVPLGQRMDIIFSMARIGMAWFDTDVIRRNIEKAKSIIEEGGDWERRNRLKVYEGAYSMSVRDFKKAARLFLDSTATFSSGELMSYRTFVFYTVLMSIIALERPELKKKVVNSSEILTVLHEIPNLTTLLNSLYACEYKSFFQALADIYDQIKRDRLLSPHVDYYTRELRILAYSQFLESYRSVTLDSMARTFGISVNFLDTELSRFIAARRLNCKVDKVGGVVETNRPDAKNAQYQAVIKQGDLLLNRIQKLSVVSLKD